MYIVKDLLTSDDKSKQIKDSSKLPEYLYRLYATNRNYDMPRNKDVRSDDLVTDLVMSKDEVFKRIFVGPYISEA